MRCSAARRDNPDVSASMWRSAAAGSAKPSAASRRPASSGVSRSAFGRDPGDRFEQRPVEELLVQPAHLARVQRPLGLEHVGRAAAGVGPESHAARQRGQLVRVLGHQVRAAHPAQLQAVLGRPQEPVRVGQADRVVAADVATGVQRGEGRQGRPESQRLVAATVHELQQLDRELDVAQARPSRA